MWQLTKGWYADRLDPEFRPRSLEASQRLLTDAGLIGDFWQLP